MSRPRFTLVIFDNRGRGARQLRLDARAVLRLAALSLCALSGALWLGWTIGELTARL
ncbi:MAG TPA: hypothetical protein VF331_24315 [Polyangiales bacterium]